MTRARIFPRADFSRAETRFRFQRPSPDRPITAGPVNENRSGLSPYRRRNRRLFPVERRRIGTLAGLGGEGGGEDNKIKVGVDWQIMRRMVRSGGFSEVCAGIVNIVPYGRGRIRLKLINLYINDVEVGCIYYFFTNILMFS